MRSTNEELQSRRNNILKLIKQTENNSIGVDEIAQSFNVSTMTVRRDLDELEDLKLIERFHGGARLVSNEDHLDADEHMLRNLNNSISEKAAEFIKENETIFINSSSTALHTLAYLTDTPINLFTNNLKILNYQNNPSSNILVTGGEIRPNRQNALVGNGAIRSIEGIYSSVTIIGCSGLSVSSGISTNNLHEATLNHLYLKNSNGLKILVANHTKINHNTNFHVCDINEIDIFITDRYASSQNIREIESYGVTVIQA
ncbi:DeoR/GlpR transcriptional regulator [Aerococcaceae bacterium DSM 111020]|nr:DeoR/GlpR transcriptional regulator [Aerococcaceae bacterium DSM 111020]